MGCLRLCRILQVIHNVSVDFSNNLSRTGFGVYLKEKHGLEKVTISSLEKGSIFLWRDNPSLDTGRWKFTLESSDKIIEIGRFDYYSRFSRY